MAPTHVSIVPAAEPRDRPARRLAEILAPVDPDRFLRDDYGRRPLVVRGWPGKLEGLLSWTDLNRALRATHLQWLVPEMEGTAPRDRVLATVGGEILDPSGFFPEVESLRRNRLRRLDPVRLTALLRRRATLQVRELDHLVDAVADLAERLERDLGDPVAVAAFASFTPTPGSGVHLDEQDSLILQLDGRKHWRVWEPTRRHPVHNDIMPAPRPVDDPVLDIVIEPGDVAYVPRGWFHSVAALEEPSLHLTVSVYKRTGVDLLAWIQRRLLEEEVVRADVPRHADADERALHGRRLVAALAAMLGEGGDVIDRYLAAWDAGAAPRRPTFSLPWSATTVAPLADDLRVHLLAPVGSGKSSGRPRRPCSSLSVGGDGP